MMPCKQLPTDYTTMGDKLLMPTSIEASICRFSLTDNLVKF